MWNAAKLFTGWVDVPLTDKGIQEAIDGGKEISKLPIDEVHVSTLIRAQMTAMLALSQHEGGKTPVFQYTEPENGLDNVSQNEAKMVERVARCLLVSSPFTFSKRMCDGCFA